MEKSFGVMVCYFYFLVLYEGDMVEFSFYGLRGILEGVSIEFFVLSVE